MLGAPQGSSFKVVPAPRCYQVFSANCRADAPREPVRCGDSVEIGVFEAEFDGDILSELDEGLREEVINILNPQVLADAVRDLESDDVVDLVEDLHEKQKGLDVHAMTMKQVEV